MAPRRHPALGLAPLEACGYTFDWVEDAVEWSAGQMEEYPLVVLTKSNNRSSRDETAWVTPAIEAAFVGYVRRGNGLLVIHSGSAGYQETPTLRGLMGGVFLHHPPQCPVTVEPKARASPHDRQRPVHPDR